MDFAKTEDINVAPIGVIASPLTNLPTGMVVVTFLAAVSITFMTAASGWISAAT